jgi:hypothetical protein
MWLWAKSSLSLGSIFMFDGKLYQTWQPAGDHGVLWPAERSPTSRSRRIMPFYSCRHSVNIRQHLLRWLVDFQEKPVEIFIKRPRWNHSSRDGSKREKTAKLPWGPTSYTYPGLSKKTGGSSLGA